MDYTFPFLPAPLSWGLNLLSLAGVSAVIGKTDWRGVIKARRHTVWFVSILCLSLIWMIRARLDSGLNIHLSGAMLITLMFGWRLGILAMTLVCVCVSLWGNSLASHLGLAVLINAGLSVSLCYLFFLLIEAFLPRNLYIYLYLSAFFGAALSFIITGTVSALLLARHPAHDWRALAHEYLPYYYPMRFAEAFVTCGLITLFVVYRPHWVYSFRDERYLQGK